MRITMSLLKHSKILNSLLFIPGISYFGYVAYKVNKKDTLNLQDFDKKDTLNLQDFECKKITDLGENSEKSVVRYVYSIPNTNKEIGLIEFNTKTGCIGWCLVHKKYRYKTLGTQMINSIKEELRKNNVTRIYFYSCSEDVKNKFKNNNNITCYDRGHPNCPMYEMNIA